MKRLLSIVCGSTFIACVLACSGASTSGPETKATTKDATVTAKKTLSPEEIARRKELWRVDQEEKALELSQKADALEVRLTEREATYKRRVEAGALDYSTKQEIDRLKKEIPQVWQQLADLEDLIAAGPPASLFVVHDAPPEPPAPSAPSAQTPEVSPSNSVATYAPGPNRPKTVHVNGYTKKDGTKVAPYTRSSPRR